MIRQIIHIDQEKCNGCGLCATACHEGAIEMVNGKAQLVREHFCDGLGDCLPGCPTGAITFEQREAPAYDEAAVQQAKAEKQAPQPHSHPAGGCPGSRMMQFSAAGAPAPAPAPAAGVKPVSRLGQWPVQIKLTPVQAPFFQGAKLLVAADCAAYAYASFHEDFMRGKVTLIAAPSWTGWTTPKSSPTSSVSTTSRVLPSSGWRCPAAAGSSPPSSGLSRPAASSSPGRW